MSNGISYRPDIDGLRAVSVLAVIFYHLGFGFVAGGYLGVDVFFVISGYVITLSVMSMLEKDQFSILEFYNRRIKRIFPALAFMLLLTWVGAYFILLPDSFVDYSKSLASASAFASNIYFWQSINYFNAASDMKPLLHTWSLSVEEQYYIFMPVFLLIMYRFFSSKFLPVLAVLITLSFVLSCISLTKAPTANFYLLPTRAWELLLGAFVAFIPQKQFLKSFVLKLLGIVGAILIVVPILFYNHNLAFPAYGALAPCVGAALIIWVGSQHNLGVARGINHLLGAKPLVFIGLISFSLYLIHWPLIVFFKYYRLDVLTTTDVAIILISTFILSLFSWQFIEKPFRYSKKITRTGMISGGVLCFVFVGAIGLFGVYNKGFEQRFPDYTVETKFTEKSSRIGNCFFLNAKNYTKWNADTCKVAGGSGDNKNKVLLWGDSFANHYVPGFIEHKEALMFDLYQYTSAGCPPMLSFTSMALPECNNFNKHAIEVIKKLDINFVIISAKWTDYKSRGLSGILSTTKALDELNVSYLVIGQSPQYVIDVNALSYFKHRGEAEGRWPIAFDRIINDELGSYIPEKRFIDPLNQLCVEGRCLYKNNSQLMHSDYGHFSRYGSIFIVQSLIEQLNSFMSVK